MRIDLICNLTLKTTLCGGLLLVSPMESLVQAGSPHRHSQFALDMQTILVALQQTETEVMSQDPRQLPGGLAPGSDVLTGEDTFRSELTPEQIERIDQTLLSNILDIDEPGERALALVRAARLKILDQDFATAKRALDFAETAALEVPDSLVRDLRIMSVVDMLVMLAETQIGEATADPFLVGGLDQPPARPGLQRLMDMQQSNEIFQQAGDLAARISQPAYQSEKIFRVVERQSVGGQTIAQEVVNRGPEARADLEEIFPDLRNLVDRMLVEAAQNSWKIQRPAWRDQGLLAVTSSAATSRQSDRALEVASSIPSPVVRSEAFIRLAEAESRRGTPGRTTLAYSESARAISEVPIDDLRATLTNVLVDSLVSAGRFKDARACITLYPDEPRRLNALGAIAESQGRRGLSDEANEWIAREVQPEHRSLMYRRVNDGVLNSLERYRADAMMNR